MAFHRMAISICFKTINTMKLTITILVMLLHLSAGAQLLWNRSSKPRIELIVRLEGTKRKSNSYSTTDTTDYSNYPDPSWEFKNNYLAVNIGIRKHIQHKIVLSGEFRYKLWGFKERFTKPNFYGPGKHDRYGFSSTIINGDVTLNVLKDIMISERFSIRPRMGMTLFFPMQAAGDSTLYQLPGTSASMNYYVGKQLKTGINMGVEFNYQLFWGISATFNTVYYTPFRNTANWVHAEWGTPAMYPVSRWTKKNDGLYLGLGLAIKLRK